MSKPIVAIIGRPNVGKSTLFNKLIESAPRNRRRYSRNNTRPYLRHSGMAQARLIIIDTGGIEPKTDDEIMQKMRYQAEVAINTADVIILWLISAQGLSPTITK